MKNKGLLFLSISLLLSILSGCSLNFHNSSNESIIAPSTPDSISEYISSSEVVSETTSEDISQSEIISEDTSETISEEISETISEDISIETSEEISESTSEEEPPVPIEYDFSNSALKIIVTDLDDAKVYEAYERAVNYSDADLANYSSVEIYLPEGTIYMSKTLNMNLARRNNKPIKFIGNNTIFSGGVEITSPWEYYSDTTYKTYIGENLDKFVTLSCNGKRATLAKTKLFQANLNFDAKRYEVKKSTFDMSDIKAPFTFSCEERWANCRGIVDEITKKSGLVTYFYLSMNNSSGDIFFSAQPNYRNNPVDCYLEDNIAFLDEENEWFYDKDSGYLYYYPSEGVSLENSNIIRSNLERLFIIENQSNLYFENISIQDSNYSDPYIYGFYESQGTVHNQINNDGGLVSGAIEITSDNIIFNRCNITSISNQAFYIKEGASNVTIKNSNIDGVGCSAFFIGGSSWNGRIIPRSITITNNIVHGYGKIIKGAVGIFATYVYELEISHNTISDGAYTGISAGWGWISNQKNSTHGHYKITYNRISNVMNEALFDGGPIYVLGSFSNQIGEQYNEISHNYLEFNHGLGVIYLDEGSTSWHVYRNACKVISYDSHFLGTLFMHNPIDYDNDICQNTNTFEDNYAYGSAYYGSSTYSKNTPIPDLTAFLNEKQIITNDPIKVNDDKVVPSIYYASGVNEENCVKFTSTSQISSTFLNIINPEVINANEIKFETGVSINFGFNKDVIHSLKSRGYRRLNFDFNAISKTSTKVETLVYYISGEGINWQDYFGYFVLNDYGYTNISIDLDKVPYGANLGLEARDKGGTSTASGEDSYINISNIKLLEKNVISSTSGNIEIYEDNDNLLSFALYHANLDCVTDILLSNTSSSNFVRVEIKNNKHDVIINKNNQNHTYKGEGIDAKLSYSPNEKISLSFDKNSGDSKIDEENILVTITYNFDYFDYIVSKPVYWKDLIGNSLIKECDYENEKVHFTASSGIFTLNSTLINLMEHFKYTYISFDVSFGDDTPTQNLVTVYYYKDGHYTYPKAFSLINGLIHVSFIDANSFIDCDHIALVSRDERGYNTPENIILSNFYIYNFQIA